MAEALFSGIRNISNYIHNNIKKGTTDECLRPDGSERFPCRGHEETLRPKIIDEDDTPTPPEEPEEPETLEGSDDDDDDNVENEEESPEVSESEDEAD
jgi:hypothetical protein